MPFGLLETCNSFLLYLGDLVSPISTLRRYFRLEISLVQRAHVENLASFHPSFLHGIANRCQQLTTLRMFSYFSNLDH